MQTAEIGRVLVERGLIDTTQFKQLQQTQQRVHRPADELAAELFDLRQWDIWQACAAAVLCECPSANLCHEPADAQCLALVSAQEAWEVLVMPLRMEAEELVCATTEETLAQAMALMHHRVDVPVRFVISEIRLLEQFIAERYGYEGVELAG
ncbi:MAG: hypothetical protein WD009_09730 [Phycisphaeraceae bacterium]